MNCERARPLLTLEGELDRKLDSHLAVCPDCRNLARELEEDRTRLAALGEDTPAHSAVLDLRLRVFDAIREPDARGGLLLHIERLLRTGHRPRYATAGLTMALAITAALVGITAMKEIPAPSAIAFDPPPLPEVPERREAVPELQEASETPEVQLVETRDLFQPPPPEVMDLSLINAEDTRQDRVLLKFALEDSNILILWLADDPEVADARGGV